MKYQVETPATIFDMAELAGARTQLHWAVAKEMWAGGETFSLRLDGKLIGLFGLYPIENGAEGWFIVTADAAKHMHYLIRQIRLTLVSRSYSEIVVLCTSEAGKRIARILGFCFVEQTERGEIWHGRHFWRIEQSSKPAKTAGGSTTAADACKSCLTASGN